MAASVPFVGRTSGVCVCVCGRLECQHSVECPVRLPVTVGCLCVNVRGSLRCGACQLSGVVITLVQTRHPSVRQIRFMTVYFVI